MGQPMGEAGAVLLDVSARPVTQPLSERSRVVRLLQLGIAAGDLVVITIAMVLAAVGRTSLDVFSAASDVNANAQSVGVWIIAGWMIANLLTGTYTRTYLGVGTVEYARVCTAATSEPASGSLMPRAIVTSPVITLGRISARSSSEPTALITLATIIVVEMA